MSQHQEKTTKEHLNTLERTLDLYFAKKAPGLPKDAKLFIVKIAPWLVIIGAILSVPAILTIFGISARMSAYMLAYGNGYSLGIGYYVSIFLLAAVVILELLSLPGLFSRKKAGWNFIFYASLVSSLSSLISLNIGAFIVGTLISFYIIFQVREYYK